MANLLIIDDDPQICTFLSRMVERLSHEVSVAHTLKEGLRLGIGTPYDVILLDLEFPDGNGLTILPDLMNAPSLPEVIIITGTGDANGAKLAFKHGAWDYVNKPFESNEVALSITRALQYRQEKESIKKPVPLKRAAIIGNSSPLNSCLDLVAKASITDASVLITGETGTGKELFARAIHENSKRASENFVVVDCGTLPATLVESTLFGHEKGAFTGAEKRRDGLIAQAESGTLFLDEIGDLPFDIQKSLLRALQERRIRPLGGSKEIPVNFRLVAATNRDLGKMVRENSFRKDLLYRILSIEIKLPPLRDREQDIQEIANRKIHQLAQQYGSGTKGMSPEFIEILSACDWPGNIRELINTLEYAIAAAGNTPVLYPIHLPPEIRSACLPVNKNQNVTDMGDQVPTWSEYRTKTEIDYLFYILEKASGNKDKALQLSGISRSRFFEMLKKHNLSRPYTSRKRHIS